VNNAGRCSVSAVYPVSVLRDPMKAMYNKYWNIEAEHSNVNFALAKKEKVTATQKASKFPIA